MCPMTRRFVLARARAPLLEHVGAHPQLDGTAQVAVVIRTTSHGDRSATAKPVRPASVTDTAPATCVGLVRPGSRFVTGCSSCPGLQR
jgi:hypothetical protein